MISCYIGLGSNLNKPASQLRTACKSLGRIAKTNFICVSSVYRTSPVGKIDQPDFLNAAAKLDTKLPILSLLDALQEIENMNILEQLFNLLEPYGYIDFHLLESADKRGVDTAFISKYTISNPKLHYVNFSPNFETIDTRPIFEVDINVNQKVLKFTTQQKVLPNN